MELIKGDRTARRETLKAQRSLRAGDKRVIGVGTTIKRCDEFTNTLLKIKINLTGKDKEKEMVGEEGDDENVNEENAGGDGKGGDDGLARVDAIDSFLVGAVKNVAQSNGATNFDAEVSGSFT